MLLLPIACYFYDMPCFRRVAAFYADYSFVDDYALIIDDITLLILRFCDCRLACCRYLPRLFYAERRRYFFIRHACFSLPLLITPRWRAFATMIAADIFAGCH